MSDVLRDGAQIAGQILTTWLLTKAGKPPISATAEAATSSTAATRGIWARRKHEVQQHRERRGASFTAGHENTLAKGISLVPAWPQAHKTNRTL